MLHPTDVFLPTVLTVGKLGEMNFIGPDGSVPEEEIAASHWTAVERLYKNGEIVGFALIEDTEVKDSETGERIEVFKFSIEHTGEEAVGFVAPIKLGESGRQYAELESVEYVARVIRE